MAVFQVTSQALRDKANEMSNQNKTLKSHIETLKTQENSLSGMWEGEARETFRNVFQQDIAKMESFVTAVEQYVTALNNAAAEYDKAEAKNVNIASTRA